MSIKSELACYTAFLILVAASILLFGCATAPVAHPESPGFGVLSVTHAPDGILITEAKRQHLIFEGVPPSYFEPRGVNWWLSAENEGYAYDALQRYRNP